MTVQKRKCPGCGRPSPFPKGWGNYSSEPGRGTIYVCYDCVGNLVVIDRIERQRAEDL